MARFPRWVSPSVAYRMDVLSREEFHKIPGADFSQLVLVDGEMSLSVVTVPIGGLDGDGIRRPPGAAPSRPAV